MTQRIWDFAERDATALLNDKARQILLPGVYFGYELVKGTGSTRRVGLQMDTDPRNAAAKLGVLLMVSGITNLEDEDLLTDASLDVLAANDDDRIDIVVGTHTYNASRPPNQVTYTIREGTPGTTAFVELLDGGAAPTIRIETLYTSAELNGYQVFLI